MEEGVFGMATRESFDVETRIRTAYSGEARQNKSELYQWYRQDALLARYRLRAVAASMLVHRGWDDLRHKEMLDVGCGSGSWLRTLVEWGARPEQLHGIDLREERVEYARFLAPHCDWQVASGFALPYADASMDFVSAHTVFSSIVEQDSRVAMATEMMRVVKSDGLIMLFDFRVSDPRNRDTVGIPRQEVQRLFPGFHMNAKSLVLAPPLARLLVNRYPCLTVLLEGLCPPLRMHALYLLSRKVHGIQPSTTFSLLGRITHVTHSHVMHILKPGLHGDRLNRCVALNEAADK